MKEIKNVDKGRHLTITTFVDESTSLEWDWDALLDEVRMTYTLKELSKLGKKDMERIGRKVGIELDRRRKRKDLAIELKNAIDSYRYR